VYEVWIPYVDVAVAMTVVSSAVIEYNHSTNSLDSSVSVMNINITNLSNPTIVVVIDWNVLHLDYRSVIIILNVW
jgi:hypothetical protein